VYALTRRWPSDEKYGLTSQLRRCAVSAEANIAEGSAKRGSAEFARFLDIAHGSLSEAECLLEIARDLGYLVVAEWTGIESKRLTAARQTAGLMAAVRLRARRPQAPAALPP
jgi:four helix bundle protein